MCKTRKMPLASLNDRIEAGRLVAEAYRKQNGEMPEKRVTIAESERKFNVQWYPTEFIPEIDKVVKDYLAIISNVPRRTMKQLCSLDECDKKPYGVKVEGFVETKWFCCEKGFNECFAKMKAEIESAPKKRKRIPINRKPVKIN